MRKLVLSGLVALAAGLGSLALSSPASAAAVPASARAVVLALSTSGDKISCASPTACLAVGTANDRSGYPGIPIAAALHGTAWKPVAVKVPKSTQFVNLTGVSCKAATYCLVVGQYEVKNGVWHPAAWTWNGTALTLVVAPSLPKGESLRRLLHLRDQLPGDRRRRLAEDRSRRGALLQRDQVVGPLSAERGQGPVVLLRGRELPESR